MGSDVREEIQVLVITARGQELRSGQWSMFSSDYELEIRSRSYYGVKVLILSGRGWWWGLSLA